MDYCCDVCEKRIKIKPRSKRLKSLAHNEIEKKFTNKTHYRKSRLFDIDEIFNQNIVNHNEKFKSYLVNYDLKLVLQKEFTPHNKSEMIVIL